MKTTNKILAGIVLFALLFSFLQNVDAQLFSLRVHELCTLSVKVQDELGNPLNSVNVFVEVKDNAGKKIGQYSFVVNGKDTKMVVSGNYVVVGVKKGYNDDFKKVQCSPGGNVEVILTLRNINKGSIFVKVVNTENKPVKAELFFKPSGTVIGINKVGGYGSIFSTKTLKNLKPNNYLVTGKNTVVEFKPTTSKGVLDRTFNLPTVPKVVFRTYKGSAETRVVAGKVKGVKLTMNPTFCDIKVKVVDESGNPKRVELYRGNSQVGGYMSYLSSYTFVNLKPNIEYTFKGKKTDTIITDVWNFVNYYGEVKTSCQPGETKEVTLVVKKK